MYTPNILWYRTHGVSRLYTIQCFNMYISTVRLLIDVFIVYQTSLWYNTMFRIIPSSRVGNDEMRELDLPYSYVNVAQYYTPAYLTDAYYNVFRSVLTYLRVVINICDLNTLLLCAVPAAAPLHKWRSRCTYCHILFPYNKYVVCVSFCLYLVFFSGWSFSSIYQIFKRNKKSINLT